jgi:hypothetical protein
MIFLTPDDFKTVLLAESLDKVLANNPGALDEAVDIALDEATSFITGRYDLAVAYAATGNSRNKMLVSSLVDLALYHVYSAFSPRNIPELRGLRYQAAIDLFKGVSKGTRFLDLPLVQVVPEQSGYILFNSNPKFNF